jgi:hypothetical protein
MGSQFFQAFFGIFLLPQSWRNPGLRSETWGTRQALGHPGLAIFLRPRGSFCFGEIKKIEILIRLGLGPDRRKIFMSKGLPATLLRKELTPIGVYQLDNGCDY